MKKQEQKRTEREEYLYHNTELLLKRYRDVVWSVEVSAIQTQISFELKMDCKIEEFLEMSYEAGADLSGTDIQEQMRVMERNRKMLKLIEAAVDLLRKKKADGELYYWILYYTYLSEKPPRRVEDIIDSKSPGHFRKHKEAGYHQNTAICHNHLPLDSSGKHFQQGKSQRIREGVKEHQHH